GKPSESSEESAPPPSVAKLAGLFSETLNSPRKEVPPQKPTRRKPPCSLPLPKTEATNNGDEKLSPPLSQVPKIKVKSSPLIEKLQANLAFAPASLLPGPSPKSPGLKPMASPWGTPPSTPSSPGVQPHSSNTEESPVSFEQPPEGSHLQSYTKVSVYGLLNIQTMQTWSCAKYGVCILEPDGLNIYISSLATMGQITMTMTLIHLQRQLTTYYVRSFFNQLNWLVIHPNTLRVKTHMAFLGRFY
ncbi:capZ-interacting protein-like, partial [Engystomops pustulosus]|uniref:capZ-interacting protein-like n=1 Tax=Engystomops pustulosus TaxID=76066 RepID=UPI003AFB2B92